MTDELLRHIQQTYRDVVGPVPLSQRLPELLQNLQVAKSQYTWEEKIESLVKLAKIVGVYLDVEIKAPGSDGHRGVREQLKEVYEDFCEWRHDEPYVVDEIKALLKEKQP